MAGPAQRRVRSVALAAAATALLATGCGSSDDDGGSSTAAAGGSGGGELSYEQIVARAPPSEGPRGTERVVARLDITPEEARALRELSDRGPVKFGFATMALAEPYWKQVTAAFERVVREYVPNAEFLLTDAEFKPDKQLADVEGLLARDADVVVISMVDQAALVPALVAVNRRRTPLVLTLTAVEDAGVRYDGFCGTDNFKGGWLAGAYLADQLGNEGDVASVSFAFDVWHNRLRNRGFEDAAKAGGLNVKAEGQATGSDDGETTFQNMLTGNPSLRGGFGLWDGVGLGMAQAAMANGRDDVAVVTHDLTTPTALQIRDEGVIKATAATLTDEMGTLCGQVALKTLAGTDMSDVAAMAPDVLATPDNVEELHERLFGETIDDAS